MRKSPQPSLHGCAPEQAEGGGERVLVRLAGHQQLLHDQPDAARLEGGQLPVVAVEVDQPAWGTSTGVEGQIAGFGSLASGFEPSSSWLYCYIYPLPSPSAESTAACHTGCPPDSCMQGLCCSSYLVTTLLVSTESQISTAVESALTRPIDERNQGASSEMMIVSHMSTRENEPGL